MILDFLIGCFCDVLIQKSATRLTLYVMLLDSLRIQQTFWIFLLSLLIIEIFKSFYTKGLRFVSSGGQLCNLPRITLSSHLFQKSVLTRMKKSWNLDEYLCEDVWKQYLELLGQTSKEVSKWNEKLPPKRLDDSQDCYVSFSTMKIEVKKYEDRQNITSLYGQLRIRRFPLSHFFLEVTCSW